MIVWETRKHIKLSESGRTQYGIVWWQWHRYTARTICYTFICVYHGRNRNFNTVCVSSQFIVQCKYYPPACLFFHFILMSIFLSQSIFLLFVRCIDVWRLFINILCDLFFPPFSYSSSFSIFSCSTRYFEKPFPLFFRYSSSPLNFCPYNYYISNASISFVTKKPHNSIIQLDSGDPIQFYRKHKKN